MSTPAKAVKIHAEDVVGVALEPLPAGTEVLGTVLKEQVPAGHKFALQDIKAGEPVIKYGCPIGKASVDIDAGCHVHVHNVKTLLSEKPVYTYEPEKQALEAYEASGNRQEHELPEINAYKRKDGRIGIRNEVWIVPTVGCVNKTAELLAAKANRELAAEYPGIDGFYAWTHPYGCSQMGTDHEKTRVILADLACHPNAGAVLVLGLGCENNRVSAFKNLVAVEDDPCQGGRVDYMETQFEEDEISAGMEKLQKLASFADGFKREKAPAANLVIGMKCGGSDGLSGITANALAGQICDMFTADGAAVLLTEVPEMFGAEQLLMNRCVDESTYKATVSLINNFKDYFTRHDQVVYENPSPGNKDGGITTLEDKSLGCVQKGGKAPVCGVLSYGDRVNRKPEEKAGGVYLLEGPGNDIVSTTAMTAAGANLILFTTGRGTPLGAPVPTIKIATNHPLAQRKKGWIDFDASVMLSQDAPFETRNNLSSLILQTADGEYRTKNEQNGYREIAIMKEGVTL